MIVDVVQLRANGEKLTAEDVAQRLALRGNLLISGGQAYLLDLAKNSIVQILQPLADAVVTKVRDQSVIVVGMQRVATGEHRPQAWWCRVVFVPVPVKPGTLFGSLDNDDDL